MNTPSSGDIFIAVKVLEAYRSQIQIEAAHNIVEFSETPLGQHYAGRIGSQTIESSGQINDLITRLNDWRQSLRQDKGVKV